jgi:hypothetical protein
MKLTSTQKQALFLWLVLSPIVTLVRFYLSLTGNLTFSTALKLGYVNFLKSVGWMYLILGILVFVMFFIVKEKPVTSDDQKKEDTAEKL